MKERLVCNEWIGITQLCLDDGVKKKKSLEIKRKKNNGKNKNR